MQQRVPSAADRSAQTGPSGEGWFYDDYTTLPPTRCPRAIRPSCSAQAAASPWTPR
ncbi:MAG: hypothetical protein IPL19_18665 [Sandaracinaceae bacterium]|nr:hypothetical protein [Sandaracinaceae bacterium]